MGKDDKEDTGFGFKDKAKAEDTLRLLEEHDLNYRRLTVRGLLGRAKRVLSMTKAEEKIKNIKEAMEVFENWLADLDKNKEQKEKPEKKEKKDDIEKDDKSDKESDVEMEEKKEKKKELPSDTVPGLGFKDKSAAEGTLKVLDGRDPDYQRLAVKGLIGRAKRVLTCTRDETKVSNIKEAITVFEKFLDDFESLHLSKENNPYLSLGVVRAAEQLAGESVTEQQKSFIAAYSSVNGEYKRLRTVEESEGGLTWDIVRNNALKPLKATHAEAKLFNEEGEPTPEHLELILWAYSPEAARLKKCLPEVETEVSRKRRSSAQEESPAKKKKD
ncbi:uncharacterized protein LOC101739385 [Bombyx mori]|nr:uncharacterized protein LOC101739385 isoform X2 [Bombyx mori]XP_004922153.1 uncharacterized protein LOC101739385 isoform X2 [Bombyx mori]XP_012548863.1 uncharacterized protein LOC101739385 isoform X2 [Bombyx mori]